MLLQRKIFKSIHLLIFITIILLYHNVASSDLAPLEPIETEVSSSLDGYSHQLAREQIDRENNFHGLIRRKRLVSEDGPNNAHMPSGERLDHQLDPDLLKILDERIRSDKRKWGSKSMNVWGKRSSLEGSYDYQDVEDGYNNEDANAAMIAAAADDDEGDDEGMYRLPLTENSLPVGRNSGNPDENRQRIKRRNRKPDTSGSGLFRWHRPRDNRKRGWGKTSMNVWG